MPFRTPQRVQTRATIRNNGVVAARVGRHQAPIAKRAGDGGTRRRGCILPPEIWHEPIGGGTKPFKILRQPPGEGYKHVVEPEEIRERLAVFPAWILDRLEVVQLSTMTRRKRTCPCYGMQWGQAIYLYPIEESLIETFSSPPLPAQRVEARMFGAKWEPAEGGFWQLVWTKAAIKDYFLNNVLIHELGHLIDERNTTYKDRERYAEWFAVNYGYKASRRRSAAAKNSW